MDFDSKIVHSNELKQHLCKVCQFDPTQEWSLLYRGSEHGFEAANFHSKCDNKPNTLTIIKSSRGHIFGGFTQATWETKSGQKRALERNSLRQFKLDRGAFIFSLKNDKEKSARINVTQEDHAIFCDDSCGPYFGQYDIKIGNNSNINQNTSQLQSYNYTPPRREEEERDEEFDYNDYVYAHHDRSIYFLAGESYFFVAEIEVFQLNN